MRTGSRKDWSSYCLMAVLMLAAASTGPSAIAAEPAAKANRPNVVFICTDDQARWALGCYGNREIQTPNLDRIARQGALVRNAFTVTPVCSPSRASLMTSRYSTQFGISDWIDPRKEPDVGLAPSAIVWPELLKANGYTNGLFGKWHLGTRDEFHPTRQGYDVFYGFRDGGNKPIDPRLEVNGVLKDLKGSLPDLLVDQAIGFIDAHRSGPFLVSLHFREPHAPYAPVPEEDSAVYRSLDPTIPDYPGLPREQVKKLTREYYASVHAVDRNVGRLLDRLDALGLAANTIVVFTSDHGYMIGHHGLHHKGNSVWIAAGKEGPRPNMFDDSIRVPLLVRWPGVIKAGTTLDQVVSNVDIFPTMLDLIGLGLPPNLKLEGKSFAPLLLGKPIPWDDTLFGQYDMHHYQPAQMRMIRTPEWKLIRHFEAGGSDELYNLNKDPGETENLAGLSEHREIQAKLNERLKRWMASIDDPLAERR